MLSKLHSRRSGFTLVEIMIVVAIIALLAAIAVPSFLRARKRSQATATLETLRMIDGAKDQYALENAKSTTTTPAPIDLASARFAGLRSKPVTMCPASIRRRAMLPPMRPRPIKPSCMARLSFGLR